MRFTNSIMLQDGNGAQRRGVDAGAEVKAARAAEGQGPSVRATVFLSAQTFSHKARDIPTI